MKYLGAITNDYDLVTKKYVDDAAKVIQTLTSGTAIGSVGGTTLYAPASGSGTITSVKTTAGTHSTINVTSGAANFNVPTKTSHLTNDSGFTNNTGTITGVTAGTGLSGGGTSGAVTLNHSNSITAGTIGSSSASQGSTVAIPYATYDSNGHITGKGTHTHTITGFLTAETDPIFAASAAAGISSSDISNWNNKVDKVSSSATSFTIGGMKFMWGSVSINLSSGSSGSGTYATPYRKDSGSISLSFSDVPYVWVTIAGSWTGTNIAHPLDITATSMKIRLLSSAKPDNSKTIRWLAIGKA